MHSHQILHEEALNPAVLKNAIKLRVVIICEGKASTISRWRSPSKRLPVSWACTLLGLLMSWRQNVPALLWLFWYHTPQLSLFQLFFVARSTDCAAGEGKLVIVERFLTGLVCMCCQHLEVCTMQLLALILYNLEISHGSSGVGSERTELSMCGLVRPWTKSPICMTFPDGILCRSLCKQ